MAVLIHVHQGVRTLYLTFCQRLVQFGGSSERADKISRETFLSIGASSRGRSSIVTARS
jgi:hypothetical protein